MGKIFNVIVDGFVSFFKGVINGSLFDTFSRLVDDFFTFLPTPLIYLLSLVVIACLVYLIKNIASFILEVLKP